MITADVSCRIFEADFSGIEALLTGRCLWQHGFSSEGAKQYIRLARCGIHSAVTARAVEKPVDLTLPDADLKLALDAIKEAHPIQYDLSKRTVHAKNFGMSTYGQVEKFPEYFPTLAVADRFEKFYFDLAPDLPKWHQALRKQAREHGYLGGVCLPGSQPSIWNHPYGYKHWFWDVLSYQPCQEFTARKWLKDPARAHRITYLHGRPFRMQMGSDGNRCIAFYPQSTAAGRLKEAELDLFDPQSPDFIGDCYFGRTPLLGPIHDSVLLHIPNRCFDRVAEIVIRVMQQPSARLPIPLDWGWGPYLPIGVSAKSGKNWMEMEKLKVPSWVWRDAVPTAGEDAPVLPRESEGDPDDWTALARAVA